MQTLIRLVLFSLLLLPLARADIVVVVGANSPIARLNKAQLAEIFSGRTRIVNGITVTPLEYVEAERERFYQQILGRSSSQMRAAWAKLLFTGEGEPPREAASFAEVRERLVGDPSLISYVDDRQLTPALKVVYP